MRLNPIVADDLLDSFMAKLSGGSVVIYAGPQPANVLGRELQRRLVSVPLPLEFTSAMDGVIRTGALPLGINEDTGEAAWGQFLSAGGIVVADGSVGTSKESDIVLSRTDLERNGTVEITALTLRLPMGG